MLSLLPGMGGLDAVKDINLSENEMKYVEAIIYSMTLTERAMPQIINGARKRRIAAGSGTNMREVNRLLKQFAQTKQMMSVMAGGGMKRRGLKKPKINKKMAKKLMGMRDMFPGM